MAYFRDQVMVADLKNYLEKQATNGYGWVVYNTDKPINNQFDFQCFTSQIDAEIDAKEYQQIFNWHEAVPISNLIYELRMRERSQSRSTFKTELDNPNSKIKINKVNMDGDVNRAKVLWENWEKRVSKIRDLTGNLDDKQTQKYKYKYLTDGLHRLSVNPTDKEKLYIHAIKVVTAKLRKDLYPNPIVRFLKRVQNELVNRPIYLFQLKDWKKESAKLIQEQFKSAGFNHLVGKIDKELDFEREKIHLKSVSNVNGNDKLEVTVRLAKIDEGAYQYRNYTATLITENGETKSATFFPNDNIKISDALNLLEGRPIFKTSHHSESNVWMQLGQVRGEEEGILKLHRYAPDFEYELKKILLEHSIKLEMYGISINAVQKGIEAGNSVGFEVPEKGKFYLSANPLKNTLNFFDAEKKPISFAQLNKIIHPVLKEKKKEVSFIQQKEVQQDNQLRIS